jgi:hypothetical protein
MKPKQKFENKIGGNFCSNGCIFNVFLRFASYTLEKQMGQIE